MSKWKLIFRWMNWPRMSFSFAYSSRKTDKMSHVWISSSFFFWSLFFLLPRNWLVFMRRNSFGKHSDWMRFKNSEEISISIAISTVLMNILRNWFLFCILRRVFSLSFVFATIYLLYTAEIWWETCTRMAIKIVICPLFIDVMAQKKGKKKLWNDLKRREKVREK